MTTKLPLWDAEVRQVCSYCKDVAIRITQDNNYHFGCSKVKVDGAYKRIALEADKGDPVISGYIGCGKFSLSGLPAHPCVLERMVALQQEVWEARADLSNIPVSEQATENGAEFVRKILQFPHKDCDYQLRPIKKRK